MTNKWHDLLQRGLQGESLVREWLKIRGFYVLPTSLIQNGGAPALEGHLRRIVASNNLVAGGGQPFWAEIKTYQRASFNQKRQRLEHGVPQRLWHQYKEGQRITGITGYLFILQLNENMILEGKLDDIEIGSVKTSGSHHPPSGPQIFFDVRRFEWYPLETLELIAKMPKALAPKTVRPWEEHRKFPKGRQLPLERSQRENT